MTAAAPVVIPPAALPDRPKARKLYALTSLRFLAAAMIVVHHTRGAFGYSLHALDRIPLDQAVSFFFVLSGFILTYVYPELPTWQARGRFFQARFGRIWPAHVAALVLVYLLLRDPTRLGTPRDSLLLGGVYLAMLQSWIPLAWVFFSYNSVAWSISTEFGFYYLFPLLIHNFRRTWHLKLALAAGLALGMITLANQLHLPGLGNAAVDTGVTSTGLVYINPLARLFEFVLGMCVALLWRNVHTRLRLNVFLGTCVELVALALLAWNLWEAPVLAYRALGVTWLGRAGSEWLVHGGVSCLSFALLIFVMASELGVLARTLSAPLGVVLGEISFTVYLIHQVLVRFYVWKRPVLDHGPMWLQLLVYWVVLLLMAHLIWACVERPLRGLIVSIGRRGPQKPGPASEPVRGAFAWALNPGRDALVGEGLLLAAFLLPVVGMLLLQTTPRPTAPPAGAAASSVAVAAPAASLDRAQLRDVRFGDVLVLKSIRLTRTADRGLQIQLSWECAQSFEAPYRVAVHVLSSRADMLAQDDFDLGRASARAGDTWTDTHTVAAAKLAGAADLGLGVYQTDLLLVDRGPRDWKNHRLRLPLPQ